MENGRYRFYAVKKGRIPGIYLIWEECSAQVNGFKKNEYKGFHIRAEAEEYMRRGGCFYGGGGNAFGGGGCSQHLPLASVYASPSSQKVQYLGHSPSSVFVGDDSCGTSASSGTFFLLYITVIMFFLAVVQFQVELFLRRWRSGLRDPRSWIFVCGGL
ncbi:hypothetical protein S245_004101 [Arachis hypogaea]